MTPRDAIVMVVVLAACAAPDARTSTQPNDTRSVELVATDSPEPSPPAAPTTSGEVGLERALGTQVSMPLPSGFEDSPSWTGFVGDDGASIVISELQAGPEEAFGGFTDEGLESQGMRAIDRQMVTVDGREGILITAEQSAAGIEVEKLILATGEGARSIVVMATYPAEVAEQYRPTLEDSLRNVRWEPDLELDPFEGLSFAVTETADLKFRMRLVDNTSYAATELPNPDPTDPVIQVGPSLTLSPVPVEPETAERRIRELPLFTDVAIEASEPIEVAGLNGHEVVAAAVDRESGERVVLYLVMLSYDLGYYLFSGSVGEADRDRYLPQFRELVESFRQVPSS